jgi:hypothetical protein
VYYDIYDVISNTLNNYKARVNKADLIITDFNDIVEKVLNEYKANLIRKRVLTSNIINKSTKSSAPVSEDLKS